MEYLSGVTVNQELSLPGLNDSFKTSILEDENKRLRQSLRRSRSVLGTPVTSICVAGAGFGLQAFLHCICSVAPRATCIRLTVPHSSADLSELIAWKQQISTYSGVVAAPQKNTQEQPRQ